MAEDITPSNNGHIHSESADLPAGPSLVPQPHGGALLTGGKPGNKGGTGRAPSVVRERCRGSFYERVHILEKIADLPGVDPRDRVRALDVLGKYGLMTGRLDVEEVRARLARTVQTITELAEPDVAERLLTALDRIWNPERD